MPCAAYCAAWVNPSGPLYFISVAALINIGLDIFFVAVLGMQADGTAIAPPCLRLALLSARSAI